MKTSPLKAFLAACADASASVEAFDKVQTACEDALRSSDDERLTERFIKRVTTQHTAWRACITAMRTALASVPSL